MVARLPRTRNKTEDERVALAASAAALESLRDRLAALVDEDSAAYDAVVAAYRLPKGDREEQHARQRRVQESLLAAAATPVAVMECCDRAMGQAALVAAYGSPAAASDIGVAVELLRAASHGAHLNVGVNLDNVSDPEFAGEERALRERADGHARAAATGAVRVRDILSG
jgi:formiminotetrahydrofolate cyclodeaminase